MSKSDLAQQVNVLAFKLDLPTHELIITDEDVKVLKQASKAIESIDSLFEENFELKRQNDFLSKAYQGCQKTLTQWISGYHKLIKERDNE